MAKEKSVADVLTETTKAPRNISYKSGSSPGENTNTIVSRKGWAYIEEVVEQDLHYHSAMGMRMAELVGHKWQVTPHVSNVNGKQVVTARDSEICEFVEQAIKNMDSDIETDIVAMMTAIGRGFSLSEINFKKIDFGKYAGKIGLKNIKFREQRQFSFRFDEYGDFDIMQTDPDTGMIPKEKMIHIVSGWNDENPYGKAIAASCAFWVWIKQNGVKYWAIFGERFGTPLAKLDVPRNSYDDKVVQEQIKKIMNDVENATGIAVPDNMKLSFMEAVRNGEANFAGFVELANKEISKAIIGATLNTDTSRTGGGSYALGKVHQDAMGIFFLFDMIAVASKLNIQLIRRLVDLNFAEVDGYPEFNWMSTDATTFITVSQGIEALTRVGVKIPSRYVNELLGIPVPREGEEVLSSTTTIPQSVEPPQTPTGIDNKAYTQGVGWIKDKDRYNNTAGYIKKNEKIISAKTTPISAEWEGFANKIAKQKSFTEKELREFEQDKLAEHYAEAILHGKLRGIDDVKSETHAGYATVRNYDYRPFDKILEDYVNRGIVTRKELDMMSEEAKRKSFAIANVDSETVLKKIHSELNNILIGTMDQEEIHAAVIDIFTRAGLMPMKPWHCEVVVRNNLNESYTDGRFDVFNKLDESEFPCLQFVCVKDGRERASHAKLDGYTRRKSDQVWNRLRTPIEDNCRCTIRAVHRSESYVLSDWTPNWSEYRFLS